ncbi:MAG: septum formation initiator family protein [Candidatus Daviesbacteria bacterium]|nr:septum formation initiator family protein [Candidatus Daviesbacteria bacterium]
MKRKLGIIFILIVMAIIVYNLNYRIYSALKAGDRLTEAYTKLHQIQVQNTTLQDQLKKTATPDFIEQQARDKLGFAKAGETVVVIPQSKIEAILGIVKEVEEKLPNWQGWLRVFWH